MSKLDEPLRIKRQGAVDNIRRRQELGDVAFILSHLEGRRFYWRLLDRCGIHRSSFTGNNTTFFQEGERNIGLILLADLEEADPEAYLRCLLEARGEQAKNAEPPKTEKQKKEELFEA